MVLNWHHEQNQNPDLSANIWLIQFLWHRVTPRNSPTCWILGLPVLTVFENPGHVSVESPGFLELLPPLALTTRPGRTRTTARWEWWRFTMIHPQWTKPNLNCKRKTRPLHQPLKTTVHLSFPQTHLIWHQAQALFQGFQLFSGLWKALLHWVAGEFCLHSLLGPQIQLYKVPLGCYRSWSSQDLGLPIFCGSPQNTCLVCTYT